MHVRFSQVAGDPQPVSDVLRHVERDIRPAVETQPGCMGLALHVSAQPAVVIVESFWATSEALQAPVMTR
jgi:quinol monooxygenase YgiN